MTKTTRVADNTYTDRTSKLITKQRERIIELEIAVGLAIEKMAYGDNAGAADVLRTAIRKAEEQA